MSSRSFTVLFLKERDDDVKMYILYNPLLEEFVVFGSRRRKYSVDDENRSDFYMRYDAFQLSSLKNFVKFVLCMNPDTTVKDNSVDIPFHCVVDLYSVELYPHTIHNMTYDSINEKCDSYSEIVGYNNLELSNTRLNKLLRMIMSA
jgi:hypothetical protein